MDKPKHKDGMLAAGKKRLEQFRQKKQGKGSKASTKHTPSDDLEAANNRSDIGSYEVPIGLKVVRADATASQMNTDYNSSSDLGHGSAHTFNLEEKALEQYREAGEEKVEIGSSEICLRIDSLDSSGLHFSSSPPIIGNFETPIKEESLAGGFDSGRVSVVPDLSISMADFVVPETNVNHDLVNDGDGTTELSCESVVMNPFCSDNTEAVKPFDKEQELTSSLESGGAGMPLCPSTNELVLIAAEMSSEHGDEKASELYNQEADFTGSNHSECATSPEVSISLQSTSRGDEKDRSGLGHDLNNSAVGMLPGFNIASMNLECMGVATEVMNKEQTLSSSSDSQAGTFHLTEVGFHTDVAGAAHLAVLRPDVDLPPVSEAPSGAHALESHIDDIVVDSGAVESSNKEQPRTEELNDTKSDSGVTGMPVDSSLNQAGVGLNNDCGPKESSDDSYQDGMPVAWMEDMTSTAGAEEVSDSGALEHENTVLSLHSGESTPNNLGIGEDATSVALIVDTAGAGGELNLEHVPDEGSNLNIVLNNINSERVSTSSGFFENIKAEASLTDREMTCANTDKPSVPGTAVQPEEGTEEPVHVECMVNPIEESLSGDGLSCSMQNVEVDQALGEDTILNLIEGDNTGIMEGENHCSVNPSKFEVNAENTSNVNQPKGIVTSSAVHDATADSLNTNEAHILGSDNDGGFSGSIMDLQVESKARSEVEVNPLDSCLVSYGRTEEVQGGVEEVRTNEGSDSPMDEMALQLRADKAVEEFVLGQNLAEEVTRPVIKMDTASKYSSASLEHEEGLDQGELQCCSEELCRAEVSLESKFDEPDSASGALAVDNGFSTPIEDNVGDGLLDSSYMHHEVDTSPALDGETSLGNTTEQRKDIVLSGNGSLKHGSDVFPSPLKGDLPLDLKTRAVVDDCEEGSDSNFTKTFQSSLDAEPTLGFNHEENQEQVLTSDETVKFGDQVGVTGTDSERGQEPAEVSQFEPAVQSFSMSKVESDSIISDSCKNYEVVSLFASPNDCAIELPLVVSPNNTVEGETEHLTLNPVSQELRTGTDVNQNDPVELPSTSAQGGHSWTGQESKGFDKSDLLLESLQEGHSLTGHESRGFDDLPLIDEAGIRNETLGAGLLQHAEDVEFEEQCRSNKIGIPISSGNEGDAKEKKELEDVIRELRDSLCMKETELDNLSSLLNSQATKNNEDWDMTLKVLMHVVKRLGHLVSQGSNVNEDADLHIQHLRLYDADNGGLQGAESINLDSFLQACDHWMDEMQRDLEEKRQMQLTGIQLEDALFMKDSDIKGLIKNVKELSQNCDELQKELEQKKHLESHVRQLEELVTIRDMDIGRLSDKLSELTQNCDLAMDEVAKAVEERVNLEGELKYFQELHAEKESNASLLKDLLSSKDMNLERLSNRIAELSQNYDLAMGEVAKSVEKRVNLEGELEYFQKLHAEKESKASLLEDLLSSRDLDLERLSNKIAELSQNYDLAMGEAAKSAEERVNLEGELEYFQKLHAEKESKAILLEDLLSSKDMDLERFSSRVAELSQNYDLAMGEVAKSVEERLSLAGELNHLQRLTAELEEEHLRMCAQASALADKISSLLSPSSIAIETIHGDAFGTLEILVASLQGHYETVCRESEDRASDADAAYEVEVKNLRALLSAKEAELAYVQEKINFLSNEISKTKEDGERKVQEAEQKALGVRERLSLAVTKGKGLVQQRDNLKQVLAEKTAELEALSSSCNQELHVMKVALNEAESKVKLNSEAVERVEALESELSYIRNSANALRESFLQKDAVLQKIEELLEDANLPEELQIKDIFEKVEWLLEAYTQQTTVSEGQDHSETGATRGMGNFSVAEQASQMQEIEQLNRKCDELLRKYRDMAEQSAMLEQCLLERNLLIQRWEEMLDAVDMPAAVRSKEPDEKLEWLGAAVSDAHTSIAYFQAETEGLQTTVDTLNHALQKLQEENSVLSVELAAKDEKLRAMALGLEDMTLEYNRLSNPTYESIDGIGIPLSQAGLRDLEERECKQEASQQQQFQIEDSGAFVTNIRTLLSEVVQEDEVDKIFSGVPASTAFETSVKLLVENSKVWSAEATDTKGRLAELTSAMRVVESDQEKELQSLHEALSLKTLELSNLSMQFEGLARKSTLLEDEVENLQKEIKVKSEELSFARDELSKSQLEFSQGEDKLASVREKLSMAVKKGKSVVQQRDALKLSLEEKTAEINLLRKEQEAENLALTKAKQSFKHQLRQVEMLEAELSSSRNYASSLEKSLQENNRAIQKLAEALDKIGLSGASRSGDLAEKIQWISQLLLDLQRKAGISEQEAKKSKKATELLALELEEVQGRMDSLADELMHAEKNISLLIEEKKSAEASKAEAGLRLEHAMANINSLLFELSESRETRANLEQENNSLKESLSAQMDEIRYKQTKAEDQLKELTDLYDKVHTLKTKQSTFLYKVADQVLKSSEDTRGIKALVLRISGELKDQGLIPLSTAPAFVDSCPSKWQPEMEKMNQGWKQGVTTGSLKLLCEEMENELQHFDNFLKSFVVASNQDSVAFSELLLEIRDGLGPLSQMMQTLKRDANFALSTESVIHQKDEQIKVLGEVLKVVAEKIRSSVEEMEVLKGEAQGQVSRMGPDLFDERMPFTSFENLQAHTVSLVERLSSTAKDLVRSHQQDHFENEKQNEDLTNEIRKAKAAVDVMGQEQQIDKLKISELQKCLEEFEVKEGILKRTNQELHSLHDDVLSTRKQEEEGLIEALNIAETKIGELSARVEELEKAKQELEASLAKALSRFYTTVNNFNKFQSLSEKLIEEAESLHLLLEDRDAQISLLQEDVALKGSEVTSLQNLVHEKTSDLSQLYQQIGGIVNRDAGGGEPLSDLGLEKDPGSRKELLEALATSARAGTEGLRVQLARKDALLQDVQLRHDDLARKVTVLESSLLENQRLMEERGHADVTERMMISVEAEEKGNRGKHATPSVAVGRGGRKVSAASDHLALDVDMESSRLLVDVDDEDKGHIFKPLTSSRLVPRGTRILVDRLDGFWVSGERLLRRRPGARLSVMLYWLVLHMWMVAILL